MGTGIGVGIILGGVVLRGEHSYGGESGHIIIDGGEDARLCGCGRRGHLEAYASATAVIKRTAELLDGRRSRARSGRRLPAGEPLTPKLVAVEAAAGDPLSLEIVCETAHYIAVGAVCLMHAVEPAGIFLGGGMTFGGQATELGRRFLDQVRHEVRRLAPAGPGRQDHRRLCQPRRRRRLHRRRRRGPAGVPPANAAVEASRTGCSGAAYTVNTVQ